MSLSSPLRIALGAAVVLGGQAAADIAVSEYLPEDFLTDASVSYMPQFQEALDDAAKQGATVVFPAGAFLIDDPAGLRIGSNTTLVMHGATLVLEEHMTEDGQVFRGEGVHNVRFVGGSVLGKREAWSPGVNIAGIRLFGASSGIRVEDMRFEDLSSNAIGLFGEDGRRITDVRVRDVVARNCCNFYGDYLSNAKGPAEGSEREDQGGVAFYHVDDWVVDGCLFAGSQSDGTHFYHSHQGRFVNNQVLDSQMGGYFLEGCRHVLASNNRIAGNGSRGVTIERDSMYCTLADNIVEHSGREGLWAPDVTAVVVTGNIFRENGRKDDTGRDCEIRIDEGERYETGTRDLIIADNLFYTSAHQSAAVLVTEDVRDVIVRNNAFRGEVEGEYLRLEDGVEGCVVEGNGVE